MNNCLIIPGLQSEYKFPDQQLPYFQIYGIKVCPSYKKRRLRHPHYQNRRIV